MRDAQTKTMRDALIEQIYRRMHDDQRIFFLSADTGAPALDKLREDFKDRFINIGIAEQNLVNISTGLALEGFIVYAYAIAAFLTMRAYEQIRTNLALLAQHKEINVNLIGVGAGTSYDMSGPSHHCIEDLTIIRVLPNILLFSPSDWLMVEKFFDFSLNVKKPKYIRLDAKPLPRIYSTGTKFEWEKGFYELKKGDNFCIISTGYMTHKALKVAAKLQASGKNIGVVDVFMLKPIDQNALFDKVKHYKTVITLEEAYKNKGGLDSLVLNLIEGNNAQIKLKSFGFQDKYLFESGHREFLYQLSGFSDGDIVRMISRFEAELPQIKTTRK